MKHRRNVGRTLVHGSPLEDFSASKIDAYYKKYDKDFLQIEDIPERIDGLFAKLAAISPEAFSARYSSSAS